ncbi:hypothetical protein [Halobacterium litoreum]|uniref:TraB family protein n=1 Tax=Halobacterium litoreum TaxID=2039234 RepID=A0ABD5NBN4_9EURY|nr:hypothetical protein [Halobacterium litoreum]UHH14646.1 hypothetical protein LT972_06510 [Halobacterium litoreum]
MADREADGDETESGAVERTAAVTRHDDPRVSGEYVRVVEAGDGEPVVLVGVVHDHPASVHRAEAVVDALAPDVVALETPDALVSLFEQYAADDGEDAGGELSAAVRAAETDASVVGVDVPGRRALGTLASTLRDADASLRTVARTLHGFGRLAVHTARGRLQAAGVPADWVGAVEHTQEYDCPSDATPTEQASHESGHVRRSTTLLRAFEPPAATRLLDAARERYMAGRLADLRADSLVVAVVGFSHLDGVEAGLAGDA